MRLVLASTSPYRKAMLTAAGLDFDTLAPEVDEDAAKIAMPEASAETLARMLARAKAEDVSRRAPDALVLGADQVLAEGARIYSKPRDRAEARDHLRALRGKTHRLISAVALAQGGVCLWETAPAATLAMRDFSDAFLEAYLDRAGARVERTVGAYEIEGLGAQLFARVEGDHFTVRGLPLLDVLAELRARGALLS